MLVIIVMGTIAFLVSSLNKPGMKIERDKMTADALAQAREALIGYAITYADTHSGKVSGYLPCPDQNGTAGVNGEGSSETCGSKNISAIGRLPWRTLGLTPLRDGNGECLWYIVAGTYKSNPMTYNMMNWDNNGLLQVLAANGATLAGQTPDSNAVALILAPGVAINGQNRTPDGSAPICGGNFTASNFLDSDAAVNANNATPSTVPNAISQFFTAGATTNINDQIIFITKSDIFNAVKKRNDFGAFVSSLLTTATTCLSPSLPQPVTVNFNPQPIETPGGAVFGSITAGRVPQSCLASPLDNWQDNLLYARCTSGLGCLTVNGVSCKGVVIFSGEGNASQTRTTDTQKNTWSNYLEDTPSANLTAFTTGGISFSGALSYSAASPSTDILACIP